jgi:hypothetical protein
VQNDSSSRCPDATKFVFLTMQCPSGTNRDLNLLESPESMHIMKLLIVFTAPQGELKERNRHGAFCAVNLTTLLSNNLA